LCSFAGYELNWVRQRRQFLAAHQDEGWAERAALDSDDWGPIQATDVKLEHAPGLLWLFGENGVGVLDYQILMVDRVRYDMEGTRNIPSNSTIALARRLFPESKLVASSTLLDHGRRVPIAIID
jgi:hypothetical protein